MVLCIQKYIQKQREITFNDSNTIMRIAIVPYAEIYNTRMARVHRGIPMTIYILANGITYWDKSNGYIQTSSEFFWL